jgi:SAM-dependent methyltransferase
MRPEDQIWQDLVYKRKPAVVRGPALAALTTKNAFISRFLKLGRSHSLLDIGCGYGEFTCLAAGSVGEAIGVDSAATAVEVATTAAHRLGVANVRFQTGSAYELTDAFAPGSFDRIVCFDLLEHVSEPERVIEQIHALLRPGGRALCYTNCYGRFSWAYLKELVATKGSPGPLWAPDARDHHLVRFTPAQLRQLTAAFQTRLIYKNHFLIPLASFLGRLADRLFSPRRPAAAPSPPARRGEPEGRGPEALTIRETMHPARLLVERVKLAVSIFEMLTVGRVLPGAGVYLLLEKPV